MSPNTAQALDEAIANLAARATESGNGPDALAFAQAALALAQAVAAVG